MNHVCRGDAIAAQLVAARRQGARGGSVPPLRLPVPNFCGFRPSWSNLSHFMSAGHVPGIPDGISVCSRMGNDGCCPLREGRMSKAKPSAFGARLRQLRIEAGLSQQALAQLAGLHRFGVAKLERGEREPAWSSVLALAKA